MVRRTRQQARTDASAARWRVWLAGAARRKRNWAALAFVVIAATLSFAHSAATNGIRLPTFRPLGEAFYAWRALDASLEARIGQQGERADDLALARLGRERLNTVPLSARALRMIALDIDARGQRAAALRIMQRAARVNPREISVHLWLADRAARSNDAAVAIRHYDTVLRISPEARQSLLPRLAGLLNLPEARQALGGYVDSENIWYDDFLVQAIGNSARITPLADLLIAHRGVLPGGARRMELYGEVMARLANENEYGRLVRLFGRLPGTSRLPLATIAPTSSELLYPPVSWALTTDANSSGDVIALANADIGIALSRSPGTSGTTARKLIAPGANRRFSWAVEEAEMPSGASARWIARCVIGNNAGTETRSADLFSAEGRRGAMLLPANCPLVLIELDMVGGTDSSDTMLTIGRLRLGPGGNAGRDLETQRDGGR